MRGCLLRWFRLATRAGNAVDERFTPAGKWLLSIAGFAGVFSADPDRTHAWLLFTSTASLLTVSLGASLLWRPRLSARRIAPPRVTEQLATTYTIALRNEGTARQAGILAVDRMHEEWPAGETLDADGDRDDNWFDRRIGFRRWQRQRTRLLGATPAPQGIDALPAGAEVLLTVPLTPLRRGWLEFERLLLKKPDPLGLCYSIRVLPLPGRVLSRPRSVPAGQFEFPSRTQADTVGATARARGHGQEFFALRDYRPGDALKHIDWRAFARRRQPVVRQYAATSIQPPLLLLDCSATPGRPQDFETMLVVGASLLAESFARRSSAVALAIVRDLDTPPELTSPEDMLDCLALLSPAADDLLDTCAATLARAAGARPVLFLTANWDRRRAALARAHAQYPGITMIACDSRSDGAGAAQVLVLRDGPRALTALAERLAALRANAADAR